MTSPLLLAFFAVFLAWLFVSAWVLIDRALYDRLLVRLRRGLRGRRVRWGTIARVVADSSSDRELAASLAAYVLDIDEARVLAAAQDPCAGWRGIEAVRILALNGHPLSLQVLEKMLGDGDEEVRAAAVTILGEIEGAEATTLLIEALRYGACPARWVSGLLDRRPLSTSLLLPLLDAPRHDVRAVATRLLARTDVSDERVDDILLDLCGDADADVRGAACRALGERGNLLAAGRLESLLDDPVWFVQVRAARALGKLAATDSANAIGRLLSSRHWWVRQAAKDALIDLGPGIRDQLLPLLGHNDPFARNSCAEVLQNLGIVDELIAEARDTAQPRRAAAAAKLLRTILDAGGARLEGAAFGRAEPWLQESHAEPSEVQAA